MSRAAAVAVRSEALPQRRNAARSRADAAPAWRDVPTLRLQMGGGVNAYTSMSYNSCDLFPCGIFFAFCVNVLRKGTTNIEEAILFPHKNS